MNIAIKKEIKYFTYIIITFIFIAKLYRFIKLFINFYLRLKHFFENINNFVFCISRNIIFIAYIRDYYIKDLFYNR